MREGLHNRLLRQLLASSAEASGLGHGWSCTAGVGAAPSLHPDVRAGLGQLALTHVGKEEGLQAGIPCRERLSCSSCWAQGAPLLRVGFVVRKDGENSTGLQHQPGASDRAELHCRHLES